MKARALALLRRLDDAAEVELFDLVPWLARHSAVPLAFLTLGLLTAGIYHQPAPAPARTEAAPVASASDVSPDASVYRLDRAWIDNPPAKPDERDSRRFFSCMHTKVMPRVGQIRG